MSTISGVLVKSATTRNLEVREVSVVLGPHTVIRDTFCIARRSCVMKLNAVEHGQLHCVVWVHAQTQYGQNQSALNFPGNSIFAPSCNMTMVPKTKDCFFVACQTLPYGVGLRFRCVVH